MPPQKLALAVKNAENARHAKMIVHNPTIVNQALSISTRISDYHAGKVLPAHADQRTRISIVLAGQFTERVGRQEQYAAAGSLVFKPGHIVHQNRFGPNGARTLSIELSDSFFTEHSGALLDQWQWVHGGPLSVLASQVWFAARTRSVGQDELVDCVADLIGAGGDQGRGGPKGPPPLWLRRVKQELHDSYQRSGQLTLLAASAHVHPVYLARQFRRYFACSVTDYAQALRLSAALSCMADGSAGLADIAHAAGYADQSHLSRAFQRYLRLAPKRCQALIR